MAEQRPADIIQPGGAERAPSARHGRAGTSWKRKLGVAISAAPFCLAAACGHGSAQNNEQSSVGPEPTPSSPATSTVPSTTKTSESPTPLPATAVPLLKSTNLCELVPIEKLGASMSPEMIDYSNATCTPNESGSGSGTRDFADAYYNFGGYSTKGTVLQMDVSIVSDDMNGESYFEARSGTSDSRESTLTIGSAAIQCTYESILSGLEICEIGQPVEGEDILLKPRLWGQQLPDATMSQLMQKAVKDTLLPGYFPDTFGATQHN